MEPIVKVLAENPPSILIAFGGVMQLAGRGGMELILLGVFLNLVWLFGRFY
jgi:hypothetical protein